MSTSVTSSRCFDSAKSQLGKGKFLRGLMTWEFRRTVLWFGPDCVHDEYSLCAGVFSNRFITMISEILMSDTGEKN